jgi:E3 ubiquitin-protein ligase FANCL
VHQLRTALAKNAYKWKSEDFVRENIERILDIELPRRETTPSEVLAVECGICYTYGLTVEDDAAVKGKSREEIPDQLCPNAKCNRVYHLSCLTGWLQSLPSTRTSFDTIFGECPYCQESISVKV